MEGVLSFPLVTEELNSKQINDAKLAPVTFSFKPEPTNFVSIIRGFQPIHESFTIDPTLNVPLSQRPPLTQTERTEGNRNNVNLKVTNAQITADIHLVNQHHHSSNGLARQLGTAVLAKAYARSDIGNIMIRMHREQDSKTMNPRRTRSRSGPTSGQVPFTLSIRAGWGDVFLSIPRNFYGPIRITSKGVVGTSPALSDGSLRTLKESSCGMLFKTRDCFVGRESSLNSVEEEEEEEEDQNDYQVELCDHQANPGFNDEIKIEAKGGCVYIQYDDETLGYPAFPLSH